MGNEFGEECTICRKGCKANQFNITNELDIAKAIDNLENCEYETVGFGPEHLYRMQIIEEVII